MFAASLLLSACTDENKTETSGKRDAGEIKSSVGGGSGASENTADSGVKPSNDTAMRHEASSVAGNGGSAGQHACGQPYPKDPRDDTMTGELVRIVTNDNKTPNDPSDDQYDVLLPQEMIDWLNEQNWIQEHGDWHNVRRCSQSCQRAQQGIPCQTMQSLIERGLSCAAIQEGEPGDGYTFLVMHRHMIRAFHQAFPKHVEQIRGFYHVPKSKDDPENPIPWVNVRWSDAQLETIDWMENIGQHAGAFKSEDDYARWVELGDAPIGMGGPGQPGGAPGAGFPPRFSPGAGPGADPSSDDLDAGVFTNPFARTAAANGDMRNGGSIHGGLHSQWAVPGSSSPLVDNNKNVKNFAFWRLHVWIDDMWERYRRHAGLGEDDPAYQQALLDQCEEMHELGKALPFDPMTSDSTPVPVESGVFATDVAPTFNTYCGGSVCHGADSPTLGLALAGAQPSVVRRGLVGQRASEAALSLVEPGHPEQSWLYLKLTGDFANVDCSKAQCTTMPPAGARPSQQEVEKLRAWIAEGAKAD